MEKEEGFDFGESEQNRGSIADSFGAENADKFGA